MIQFMAHRLEIAHYCQACSQSATYTITNNNIAH